MSIILNETWFLDRKATGSYVDGWYVDGSTQTYIVKCNVQPLTGKDLQILAENNRYRQGLKVYSLVEIKVDDIFYKPDSSLTFKVVNVENWNAFNTVSHYKAIMYLEEGQENE